MNLGDSNQRFGIYWLAFGYTLALHVLDEAGNDFLSFYNPNALYVRRLVPHLPLPVFTFRQWIGSLLCALALWLALAPLAFRGLKWQRRLAIPVALLAGIGNALETSGQHPQAAGAQVPLPQETAQNVRGCLRGCPRITSGL